MLVLVQLGAILALTSLAADAPRTHCAAAEVPIFYCGIDKKNLSVCQLKDGRVSYRYGRIGEPAITIDSPPRLSHRPYPGGGEARLRFSRGAHDYLVFDLIRYSGGVDEETGTRLLEDRAGVHVLKDGKRIATLTCTAWLDSDSGNLQIDKLKSPAAEDFDELD